MAQFHVTDGKNSKV